MTTSLGKFVWFDHVSTSPKQAQAFYGEVFGWRVQDVPMGPVPYQMIAVGDTTVGGYAPPPADARIPAHWIASLQVANADEAVGKVTRAGGAVHLPPTKMGEFGTMASVADPLGGALNLWQPAKADDAAEKKPADGHFVWNELWATDVDRSLAFYKAIGGYTVDAMDMGPMGTYHVLKNGDESRAGIMKSDVPGVPQMWLPYVQVAKADTTVERAKKAGAEIVVPPSDIPGIGRFAVFKDPTGAALGILQPA
jgi:predicted enzyme related to lactoylglutathione lyase